MQTDSYSQFNSDGVPTHDQKGNEIPKELYNKLVKDFKAHQIKYEKNQSKNIKKDK